MTAGQRVPGRRRAARLGVGALFGLGCGLALAQGGFSPCGSLVNGYGPYDYRTDRDKLPIVEGAHFTAQVENLIRATTGYLGGDIDYTLRAFPNHHRALLAMMRLGERVKRPQVPSANYSVECYFDRALRFRPDDTTARMLFATFLNKSGREPEAVQQLEQTIKLADGNPFTIYNVGLVYFEMKQYDRALEQAHAAVRLGFTKPELRLKLESVGKWVEAPMGSESAAHTAASASAPAAAASEAN